jgi:hypothetical protein
MSGLTIVLLILVIQITIFGVVMYFLWKKWGKKLFNMFDNIQNMSKDSQIQPKLPFKSYYQQELEKINKIVERYQKK